MPTTAMRIVSKAVLPVASMATATAFYRRLGFDVQSYDSGYAWVLHRGEELLYLQEVSGLAAERNAASCYFHVDDANAWHADWTAAGMPVGPLDDQPWGMREFSLDDPSGNRIRVGQNI